jgi:hypothetical protein
LSQEIDEIITGREFNAANPVTASPATEIMLGYADTFALEPILVAGKETPFWSGKGLKRLGVGHIIESDKWGFYAGYF